MGRGFVGRGFRVHIVAFTVIKSCSSIMPRSSGVEQLIRNRLLAGSIPIAGSSNREGLHRVMQPLFSCGKREPASGGDGNGLLRRRKGGSLQ